MSAKFFASICILYGFIGRGYRVGEVGAGGLISHSIDKKAYNDEREREREREKEKGEEGTKGILL